MPPAPRRRAALVAVLGGLALAAAACSSSPTASPTTTAPAADRFLAPAGVAGAGFSPLHVVHPASGVPYLADAAGRQVLLNGVAAVGLEDTAYPGSGDGPPKYPIDPAAYDGTCPTASPVMQQPPLCEVDAAEPALEQSPSAAADNDFAEMRSLGVDVVRLVLDWSQLEPTPGAYSTTYLDRVAQVVGWAAQQGIEVVLDMHEDQYSRFLLPSPASKSCVPSGGYDGAPKWAVFTDGEPACELLGDSDANPAVAAAFDNFWHNRRVDGPRGASPGPGLQDYYIGALAALAKRFDPVRNVIGYELMNEPLPGSHAALPIVNVVQASEDDLYPFYRRAIEALTGVRDGLSNCPADDPSGSVANGPPPYPAAAKPCAYPDLGVHTSKLIFFEPMAYRNLLDFSAQVSRPFSSYPNLVFAPHAYTHAFTVDTFVGYSPPDTPYPPNYTFAYQTANDEAAAMHAAVFVTEFGDSAETDGYVLADELAAQERSLTGGTLWAWAGIGEHEPQCWCVRYLKGYFSASSNGTGGTGDPDRPVEPGVEIPSRALLLARAEPRATAGRLLAYDSDATTRSFALVATSSAAVTPGDEAAETVVYVPVAWHGAVAVTGAAALDTVRSAPDGSRYVLVAPSGAGRYEVTVGSGAGLAAVRASAAAEADDPLPPIGPVAARQALDAFVTLAEHSSNPSYRSNADLLASLVTIVLGPPPHL